MLLVQGKQIDIFNIFKKYNLNRIERNIIKILSSSEEKHNYYSLQQLIFELNLRSSLVKASIDLNRTKLKFEVFRESRCNPKYWERTENGGFLLKEDVKPSDAINDIYINSSMYGTECATSIVIVYYKAILDVYQAKLFNRVFNKIFLMNWHTMDPTMGVNLYKNPLDYLPGDCRYFKNPDVNPLNPEWQGENAILINNYRYYAPGAGIGSGEEIIRMLNRLRKEDATESAYLIDSVTRPNFDRLERVYSIYVRNINYNKYRSPFNNSKRVSTSNK